jgi:glycosyltransferase involved in cell wall biosynthesis
MKFGLAILNKNEAIALPTVLKDIPFKDFDEIFAVDGGSTDESLSILGDFGIDVLNQVSKGRGAAFELAFDHAKSLKVDFLMFLSSDGNEDPKDLRKMIEIASTNEVDMVIGSRMLKESWNEEDDNLLKFRKWGNQVFAIAASLLFNKEKGFISDPINGYRGVSTKAWDILEPSSSGFSIEYELSIKAYKNKLRVIEFPTIEGKRLGGKSGAKAIPTSIAMLKVLIKQIA